jgi:DNA-binding IscR family transcriptional regulator
VEAVDPSVLQCGVSTEGESGTAVRLAWENVSVSLRASLDKISLESMVSGQGAPMFYI